MVSHAARRLSVRSSRRLSRNSICADRLWSSGSTSPSASAVLAFARSVLKNPDVLVLNEATAILDEPSQALLMRNLLEEYEDRALIWLVHRASLGEEFDHTVVLDRGKCAEQGPYSELNKPGSALNNLVATG